MTHSNTFYNCPGFSILGREKTQWMKPSIKTGNYIKTPWEILYDGNCDIDMIDNIENKSYFEDIDKATNVLIYGKYNLFNCFCYKTNITLFDVYYILFMSAVSYKKYKTDANITRNKLVNAFVSYNKDSDGKPKPFFLI